MLYSEILLAMHAAAVAVAAYVYAVILTDPGMILNGWYNLLQRLIGRWPYLFKPAIDCYKCVAGQLALWFYLFQYWHTYNFFQHVFFVSFAIFLSILTDKTYRTCKP